jgi:hypothetical protein
MASERERIKKEMWKDGKFRQDLEMIAKWPDNMFGTRPFGLKEALFLLCDVGHGEKMPDELTLRKACAVVYSDHIRLEGKLYYAMKEKADGRKRNLDPLRNIKPRKPDMRRKMRGNHGD